METLQRQYLPGETAEWHLKKTFSKPHSDVAGQHGTQAFAALYAHKANFKQKYYAAECSALGGGICFSNTRFARLHAGATGILTRGGLPGNDT